MQLPLFNETYISLKQKGVHFPGMQCSTVYCSVVSNVFITDASTLTPVLTPASHPKPKPNVCSSLFFSVLFVQCCLFDHCLFFLLIFCSLRNNIQLLLLLH